MWKQLLLVESSHIPPTHLALSQLPPYDLRGRAARVRVSYGLQPIVDEEKKERAQRREELWEEGDVTGGLKTEAPRTTAEGKTG